MQLTSTKILMLSFLAGGSKNQLENKETKRNKDCTGTLSMNGKLRDSW